MLADRSLGSIRLLPGVVLSGTLLGFDNSPEVGADIDVIHPVSGAELVLTDDDTDASGKFAVIVPKGTWKLRFQSAKLSLSRVDTLAPFRVSAPMIVNHKLSLVPVACVLATFGIPNVLKKGVVIASLAFFNPTTIMQSTDVSLVLVDPVGNDTFILKDMRLPLFPSQLAVLLNVPLPLPAVQAAHLGKTFRYELRFLDPKTRKEQDIDGFKLIIR